MDILNTISLESNSCFKMNFNGGNLSSDAGLLMIYDFMRVISYFDMYMYFYVIWRYKSYSRYTQK